MAIWVDRARAAIEQNDWGQMLECLQFRLSSQPVTQMSEAEVATLLDFSLKVLESGDFQERWEIAKLFPALGQVAIAPLTTLIQDEEAAVESRWFGCRILGNFNNPAAIQVLAELLQDEDEDLSAIAADALAHSGAATIPILAPLLEQENTQLLAVQALAQIHHPEVIPPLLKALQDSQPTVRILAIEALSTFQQRSIGVAMLAALQDPAAPVRRAAVSGLGSYSDLAEELSLVDQLTDCLWDINLSVCQQAALSLGRLELDAGISPLVKALRSPHTPPALQRDCIRALGWIASPMALTALQELLLGHSQEYSVEVYQDMVATLGRWTDPALQAIAAQGLMKSLTCTDPIRQNPELRQSIALMLGHLRQPQALEPLIHLLADQNDRVRLHAIVALKNLDAVGAYQRLAGLRANQEVSQELRHGVAIALREW